MNTSNNNQTKILNLTFDQFLDSIGDISQIDIVYLYIFPVIGIIGTILNIINTRIFFHKKFDKPNFIYYKVISIAYLVDTVLVNAYGICYSPRYLPYPNTNITVMVQLIYVPIGNHNNFFLNIQMRRIFY